MAEKDTSINDALAAAARTSRLGKISPDNKPTGTAVLEAVGGVRGVIESILPSFLFLVVYLIVQSSDHLDKTQQVVIASLAPVAVALAFIAVRAATKLPIVPAVSGAVIVAVTAILAISTNNASNNFVLGLWLNAAYLTAIVISLIARRPLLGVVVAYLVGPRAAGWRTSPRKLWILTLATVIWGAMFAIRLAIQLPLYFADNAAGLGLAKLILGVPLYAVVLWITWILVRTILPPPVTTGAPDGAPAAPKVS